MSTMIAAAPVLVRQGVREHRSGRLDAAADLYRRALRSDPMDADALHLLGALHLQRGEPVAAVPFAAKAALLEPALVHAYNNLGLILKGADQAGAAARCYLHASILDPGFAEAHSNLGVVLKAEGQVSLAVQHYRRAIDIDPSLGEAWNNLGNALQELGEFEEAVEAYLVAADRRPDCDTVHYNVGLLLNRLGRPEDALVHLRLSLLLAPEREGARHLVAAIEGQAPSTAPSAYIRDLFDSYAYRFDAHLVGELGYRGHLDMVQLIEAVAGPERRFALTYDLGCGTGLSGALLRDRSGLLVGVDLSEKMLQQAERKGIYDALVCNDLVAALDELQGAPDLAIASDVLIYAGDLDPTFERLSRRMAPGGLLAFTIETAAPGLRWFLRSSGRFAHGDAYVVEALARHGFRLLAKRSMVLRHEAGVPVDGAVYLAVRPPVSGAPS